MDISFVEARTIFLIFHLVGLSLGVGGAIISDALFFRAIHDWRITKAEMGFLTIASAAVGVGLGLLIVSGLAMFFLDMEKYIASTKFLVKMTVVAILTANALLLHFVLIPHFRHIAKYDLSTRTNFLERRFLILGSGVVSIVSWLSALVLGAFRSIPWSYESILGVYVAVLLLGFFVAFLFRDRLMPVRG